MGKPSKKIRYEDAASPRRSMQINDDIIDRIVGLMAQANTPTDYQALLDREFPKPDIGPPEEVLENWDRRKPPFFENAFRIQVSTSKSRHKRGGRSRIIPNCSVCGIKLIQFANFDCTMKGLKGALPFSRLPLYYCCSCPGPVYYQFDSNNETVVFRTKREAYDEAPFSNPPDHLEAGFLELIAITKSAEEAIKSSQANEGFKKLKPEQLQELTHLIGRKPAGRWDLYFSQIGGYPQSYQGDEGVPDACVNSKCKFRRRRRFEFQYRVFAVLDLWNDQFWNVSNDAAQIVFSICPGCFTIAAKYTVT